MTWEFPSQTPEEYGPFRREVVNRLRQLTDYLRRRDRVSLGFGSVVTTDDTATAVVTVAIPVTRTVLIEATVVGRRTGGTSGSTGDGAAYVLHCVAKNIAGTVTIIDQSLTFTGEDQAGWDVDAAVSGTTIEIQVTGAVDNTVTWSAVASWLAG